MAKIRETWLAAGCLALIPLFGLLAAAARPAPATTGLEARLRAIAAGFGGTVT